jgi:hypothetical protein
MVYSPRDVMIEEFLKTLKTVATLMADTPDWETTPGIQPGACG